MDGLEVSVMTKKEKVEWQKWWTFCGLFLALGRCHSRQDNPGPLIGCRSLGSVIHGKPITMSIVGAQHAQHFI